MFCSAGGPRLRRRMTNNWSARSFLGNSSSIQRQCGTKYARLTGQGSWLGCGARDVQGTSGMSENGHSEDRVFLTTLPPVGGFPFAVVFW